MKVKYPEFKKYVSPQRLRKYEVTGLSDRKVFKLYLANIRISQSFYSILSLFEVILRNAINDELSVHFSDPSWLLNEKNGFMIDPLLRKGRRPNEYLLKSVKKVEKELKVTANQGKILAGLHFGFWTSLFEPLHYKILKGRPIKVYKKLPKTVKRDKIYYSLNNIRHFRNRIYHNEPIIFNKTSNTKNIKIDFSHAFDMYEEIKLQFEYLGLDYIKWTRRIDNVKYEIKRADCAVNDFPKPIYYVKVMYHRVVHFVYKYIL